MSEYDERNKEYWSIGNGNYKVKLAQEEGKEDDIDKVNVMPLHLGSFVLSKCKRLLNNFVEALGGFKTNDVYHGDTDRLYNENKHWSKFDERGLFGKNMLQGKNDYRNGRHSVFSVFGPEKMYCLLIDEYDIISEHKT